MYRYFTKQYKFEFSLGLGENSVSTLFLLKGWFIYKVEIAYTGTVLGILPKNWSWSADF